MLRSYLPALVFILAGGGLGFVFMHANRVLGKKRRVAHKADPYECGLPSEVTSNFKFGISFYLVAMLFILFDIEVVFLYPWGVNFTQMLKGHGSVIFWGMAGFLSMAGRPLRRHRTGGNLGLR